MRLGLNIKNTNQINSSTNPLGEETGEIIELPNVGSDSGPGSGIIFKQDPGTNTQISYWESNYNLTSNIIFQIQNYLIVNEIESILQLEFENVLNSLDYSTTNTGTTLDSTYFQSNENELYTYTDNDDLFSLLLVNSTNEAEFLGDVNSPLNSNSGWFFYFKNDIENRLNNENKPVRVFYKYQNEESVIKIRQIIINTDGTTSIVDSDINNPLVLLNIVHYFQNGELISSIETPFPVIARKFTIANPNPGIAIITPLPAALNVFPQESISYIDLNFAANYNGVTSKNLPTLVDRYRTINQIKDAQTNPRATNSFSVRMSAVNSSENSKLVCYSTANRQIIVKVTYINTSKPSAPWYDRATDETLTLECKIKCFGNVYNSGTVYTPPPNSEPIYVQESTTRIAESGTYQGQPIYFSEVRFLIDVSDIQFVNYIGDETSSATEIVSVFDKAYNGSANTYKAMLFELSDLKIKSNKRVGKTPNIPYSQTGLITVPTFKGGAYEVGFDMSPFLQNNEDDFINESLKEETEKLDTKLLDYDFKMSNNELLSSTFTTHPCYNQFGIFPFKEITGALNSNYELVNLSTSSTPPLSVSINLIIFINYDDYNVILRKVKTNNEGVETFTVLKTENNITKADYFNFTYSYDEVVASGEKLRYEIKFERLYTSPPTSNIVIVEGYIAASEKISTSPNQIKKLRPRFNYF